MMIRDSGLLFGGHPVYASNSIHRTPGIEFGAF